VDLPGGVRSGLRVVEGILGEIDDVSFQKLTAHDVVRHKLVGQIVAAYEEFDAHGPLQGRSSGDDAR
jgi:phosphate starvation-inducible protein PhoH and related proteins